MDFMSAHASGLACLMLPLHRSHTDWSPTLLPVLPREGTGTGEAADTLINSPARVPTSVSFSPQGWNGGGGQCTEAETWGAHLTVWQKRELKPSRAGALRNIWGTRDGLCPSGRDGGTV